MFTFIRRQPAARSTKSFASPIEVVCHAMQRLKASTYTQLRDIDCDFREGVLTLRGTVGSFFLKQLAQVTVGDIQGVEVVSNHLEVR